MHAIFSFLALVVVATLAVVAPTGPAPRQLHRGAAFHPLFEHVHPDAEVDSLAGSSSGQELHGGQLLPDGGGLAAGKLLPRVGSLTLPPSSAEPLAALAVRLPDAIYHQLADPPPRMD